MTPALCPRCASQIPPAAPAGLCPRCLLLRGLEPGLPRAFGKAGKFELLRRIGSGGMGVIFEARETNPHRLVALKVIRTGELATEQERARFRREAEAASRLEHANIVPIFHVSDADEPPYFTMRLMTGGTLAEQRARLRTDPRAAARVVATVARAVHYGHVRGVLHRDLKPANILLDEEGNPHVSDFGIARILDDEDTTQTAEIVGTPAYMSPEQAAADRRQITTRSDVYSLGAILFELLSGRPPFEGASSAQVFEQHRSSAPPQLRRLDATINPDLETICLKCLEKDPLRRYSAEQLADDLERYLRGDAIAARPVGRMERLQRWTRRHPGAAAFAATTLLFLVTVTIAAISVARAQEADRRQDVLKTNAFAAHSLAGLVLFQLRELSDEVAQLAADPAVLARLADPPSTRFPPVIETACKRIGFDSIGIDDAAGAELSRWPEPPDPEDYFRRNFVWRDYFRGAARNASRGLRTGYVARPHRSEATGDFKFTISAPIFGANGAWRGIIFATSGTNSVLGRQPLDSGSDRRRTAALISRRDNERDSKDAPLPNDYFILIHDGLPKGTAIRVEDDVVANLEPPDPAGEQLRLSDAATAITDDDYRDPVPGFEGRWLAGFAPVGNTGYVIVVQTRYAAVLEPDRTLVKRLLWAAGLPFLCGGVALNLLLFFVRRRTP